MMPFPRTHHRNAETVASPVFRLLPARCPDRKAADGFITTTTVADNPALSIPMRRNP